MLLESEFSCPRATAQALMETEGVNLQFTDGALQTVARVAEEANLHLENIGVSC